MTRADRIVVFVVVALAAAAWPLAGLASGVGSGAVVAVIHGPDVDYRVPLDAPRRLELSGLHGTVVIETGAGSVRVSDSSCGDHVCVARGAIDAPGETIVCAPNGVTVRIAGRSDALDAIIR